MKRNLLIVLALAALLVAAYSWYGSLRQNVLKPAFRLVESTGVVGLYDRLNLHLRLRDLAHDEPQAAGEAERPDVVLIVLDTLRRDRLQLYGYPETTMPELERWAERATVYTEARSTSSWTLPAHASLFTGRYAIEHGARGAPYGGADAIEAYALPAEATTLAEVLRASGYLTIGLAANQAFLNRTMGLAQGFDLWLCDELPAVGYVPADRMTAMALQILAAPRSKPLFLFLNYMDPHQPIRIREGYTSHIDEIETEVLPYTREWLRQSSQLMTDRIPMSPELVRSWSLGYDGELRFLDEHLSRLLEGLEQAGIDQDDIVVILSDHGESFGEHDLVEHSKDLYDELTRIPLIARGPGFRPGRDATPVQTQDVPRWILERVGVEHSLETTPTQDLQVMELYWTRQKDLRLEALRRRFDRIVRAFVRDQRKLVLDDRDEEQLYDLTADPGENHPLAEAEWAPALRDAAEAWMQSQEPSTGEAPQLDADQLESLRALGYTE